MDRKRTPDETEIERGPPEDLKTFCKIVEDLFVPQSIWVGEIKVPLKSSSAGSTDKWKEKVIYLEISITSNPAGEGVVGHRLVDLDQIDDKKRFSDSSHFSVSPHRVELNNWVPRMQYEDYHAAKKQKLNLFGTTFKVDELTIEGTAVIDEHTKNEREGTFSLVRCMAPTKWNNEIKVNNRSSALIKTYSHQVLTRKLSLRIRAESLATSPVFQRIDSLKESIKEAVGEDSHESVSGTSSKRNAPCYEEGYHSSLMTHE